MVAMEAKAGPARELSRLKTQVEAAPAMAPAIVMTTLTDFPISARAAAVDLGRARRWYEDQLGLVPEHEDPGGVWYRFAGETWLYLYATPSAGTAKNTIAGWEVKDIETVMAGLRERGVIFEEYDLGDVQMVDGLADFGVRQGGVVQGQRGQHVRVDGGPPAPLTSEPLQGLLRT